MNIYLQILMALEATKGGIEFYYFSLLLPPFRLMKLKLLFNATVLVGMDLQKGPWNVRFLHGYEATLLQEISRI